MDASAPIIDIPVVIIGGGGVGLTLSCFLSDEKVQHVLFEKHPTTSILPKAHYLNQRTLEIFRQHGLDKPIEEQGCPIENMGRVEWRTSLGGDGPFDGRQLGSVSAAGGIPGTEQAQMYRRDSPSMASNLPLLRMEPVFKSIAEERNPGNIFFSTTVEDFEEVGDHVIVRVKMVDGQVVNYRAQYVVCCDAGKLSTPKLGIKMEGITGLVDFVSTHFKADFSKYWDDRTLITHFINPEGGSMAHLDCGALMQMGPTWGKNSEEWVLTFGFPAEDSKRFEHDALVPRIRQLLKLPDLEMEVLHISHWVLDRVVADKYRVGRVFIAGDAAHRRPPTTGLGLNTGIEDAANIAWKLGQVVNGKASAALMDSYEAERRPVGIRNSDWAFFTFGNMQVLSAGVGLIPGQQEYNYQRFVNIFSDTDIGRSSLAHIKRVIGTQNIEYSAHDIELGFSYPDGARVDDGTEGPTPDTSGQVYTPTTRPGHRLPHAWVEKDGKKISTHDLIYTGDYDYLLITDEDGSKWTEAVKRISKLSNLNVGAAQIRARPHSRQEGLLRDLEDRWINLREVKNGGAILVRRDNFIAWRSATLASDPEKTLRSALEILIKQAPVPTFHMNGYTNGHVEVPKIEGVNGVTADVVEVTSVA
ncbi:uncharacterized protein PAC_10075 [Phialocephala subalpina]|uniref:FAD-binding domain-containing protein n=1 Tax=Phialocephala subalpina TaxID=576137 RepID=A0A1L7X573_9HELO|nr:uncharacterized protein PAC_10075 [Phialocephala subalpina]